ncbi:hypothetical protein SUGI_0836930 [Cryptomeria japonica]|nr:hypothetical protein SUGI_0836930 [Cryptomeria japonica]
MSLNEFKFPMDYPVKLSFGSYESVEGTFKSITTKSTRRNMDQGMSKECILRRIQIKRPQAIELLNTKSIIKKV